MDATPSQRFMKKPPEKKTGSPERVSEGKNREEEEPTARPAAGIGGADCGGTMYAHSRCRIDSTPNLAGTQSNRPDPN